MNHKAKNRSGACSWGVILFLLACIVMNAGETYAQKVDERKAARIKAGFIFHLANLATWPDGKFDSDESPVVVGFVGKDPNGIGNFFESQARSFDIRGRKLVVRQLPYIASVSDLGTAKNEGLQKCHIVFFTVAPENDIRDILRSLGGKNVLTTGETESFPYLGGMVAFVTEKNRVKIQVNLNAVEKANIKISAQLLQHAKIVKGNYE